MHTFVYAYIEIFRFILYWIISYYMWYKIFACQSLFKNVIYYDTYVYMCIYIEINIYLFKSAHTFVQAIRTLVHAAYVILFVRLGDRRNRNIHSYTHTHIYYVSQLGLFTGIYIDRIYVLFCLFIYTYINNK